MSEQVVYRTIIILGRNDCLLYGHSIHWRLCELDYTTKAWKKRKFGQMTAYYRDLDEPEFRNSIAEKNIKIFCNNEKPIHVPIPSETEEAFLEQSYDTDEYNPFITLCTSVKYFFSPHLESDANYINDNKEIFEKIESEFSLSILTSPHLLETFSIYTPTRLEEIFRGIDDHRGTGYEVAFSDPFSIYQGGDVCVQAMTDGKTHEYKYQLDKQKHFVNTGSIPDSVATTVYIGGNLVFKSSFSLVKKINISTEIISHKHIEHKGEIITQSIIEKSSFDV